MHGTGDSDIPSWQFYQDAAEEPVPLYRAEPAKSGRSRCAAKGAAVRHESEFIDKDSIRVGHIDMEAGTYTSWSHLECWRVPFKVWLMTYALRHTHAHTHTHMYMHTHTHMYIHTHTHTHMYMPNLHTCDLLLSRCGFACLIST